MSKRSKALFVALTLPIIVIAATSVVSGAPAKQFKGRLTGYQEVPVVSSSGLGSIHVRILPNGDLSYRLDYSDLEGSVLQAHIHFGQPGVNGGISAFFPLASAEQLGLRHLELPG